VPDGEVAIRSISVARDASIIAAANNHGTTFVWKLGKGLDLTTQFEPLQMLQAHSKYVLKCVVSPDTKWLATMSADHSAKIWNTRTFELSRTLVGHQKWVWDGIFSADSAYLITASSDQTARLWDLEKAQTIRQYTGHHKAVVCVTLNDSAPPSTPDAVSESD
jgi:G protein beta subunit-like protein